MDTLKKETFANYQHWIEHIFIHGAKLILAVAVQCVRIVLDPGLDLRNPGIHAWEAGVGAPVPEADHPNDGGPGVKVVNGREGSEYPYLPFSVTKRGPPESPWHASFPWSAAQM